MSAPVAIFWLVVAFLAFLGAMTAVFAVCVRERRRQAPLQTAIADVDSYAQRASSGSKSVTETGWRGPEIGHLQASPETQIDSVSDAESDNRVALVIFGGIILGALLAIAVGYVVFFSGLV
jgi:hypothetical protein